MRLILKDYIETFKEEQEMENLLDNILFMNNYNKIIRPQKGVSQLGVDFSAEKDNTIYLFVVKQGDIDKSNWNSGNNAVRPTLDEILDSYIPQRLNDNQKKIKIILCSNGIIKQNIEGNWQGYIGQHTTNILSYEFWGIDDLVIMTEKYLINEYIFDNDIKSNLRKVLYFLNEDTSLKYFQKLIEKLINKINLENKRKKIYKKSLITYTMVCRMCISYAERENLKIAVDMSEKALITYWNFLVKNNLFEKIAECEQLLNLSSYYIICCKRYILEIKKVYHLSPSFSIYNPLEYRIIIYDVIGILSTYTYYIYYYYGLTDEVNENVNLIITIINNNAAFYYPPYDLNCIEINTLIFLLKEIGNNQASIIADILLNRIITRILRDNYYPVEYENCQKAIAMIFNKNVEKCKATLLITNLLEWLYIFQQNDKVSETVSILYKKFPEITFNSIEIDVDYENYYFNKNFDNSIITYVMNYENINEVKRNITKIKKEYSISKYKFNKYSAFPYLFIASRNYRLPLPSCLIYRYLDH